MPFPPDTNLVCLALNPRGNPTIAAMNGVVRRLEEELRVGPCQPLQLREFFGSTTTLRLDVLAEETASRLLDQLGLLGAAGSTEECERLLVLRHTLMNPFLLDEENGISFIDRYFEFLARRVTALCEPANPDAR